MKSFKAPSPDGYQPYFYWSQWYMVGPIMCKFIKDIFEGTSEVIDINHSYIVLISKVPTLEYLHQFRPIGLCNVNCKI
jgi:hypothetical protein